MEDISILIVDDLEVNRLLLYNILCLDYSNISFAKDGAEACALIKKGDYDIVLMDVNMPIMNGIDATKHIRNLLSTIKQPIIIGVTASVDREEECLYAGMDMVIFKPFSINNLKNSIYYLIFSQAEIKNVKFPND